MKTQREYEHKSIAALETRPSSLSFYRNILKIGTQLPTVRIMLTRILVGLLRISHVKKLLL